MSDGAVRVRAAVPADLDALVAFNQRMAAETEDKPLDEAVLRPGVQAVLDDPAKGHYRIAECDGAVAGSLMVTLEWSDWRNGWFWWIQSVYVAPEFRRQGVYAALHASVRAAARATGGVVGIRLYVERENHGAMATYAAMGMHETVYRLYEEALGPDAT